MLSGDFELVDSDHDQEAKESKDSSFDDIRGSPNAGEECENPPAESNQEKEVKIGPEASSVAEKSKDETIPDTAIVSEKAGAAESIDDETNSSNPMRAAAPAAAPQPVKKSGGSKSSRSIAKIAEPPKEESEQSNSLYAKTTDIVSQAISSSEKVFTNTFLS